MLRIYRRNRHLLALALVGVLLALVFGCTPNDPQSTFDADGPVAQSQLDLFWIIFAAGAIVFVLVEGAILYSVIKFRRRSGDGIPPQIEGNSTVEFAWTAGPTALLVLVAIPTIFTIFDNQVSPDQGALTVDVVGHQWWFEFRYRDPADPSKEIRFANDLHIPVNEVVNVNLESVDVIHSFWIPKIAGKVDMVPSNGNTMWIQADRTGYYYGQCAEFCGVQHANMRFRVIVHSGEGFDAWLESEKVPCGGLPRPTRAGWQARVPDGGLHRMSPDPVCRECGPSLPTGTESDTRGKQKHYRRRRVRQPRRRRERQRRGTPTESSDLAGRPRSSQTGAMSWPVRDRRG